MENEEITPFIRAAAIAQEEFDGLLILAREHGGRARMFVEPCGTIRYKIWGAQNPEAPITCITEPIGNGIWKGITEQQLGVTIGEYESRIEESGIRDKSDLSQHQNFAPMEPGIDITLA